MTSPYPAYQAIAETSAGAVRQRNEDSFLLRSADGLWALSDGMGGHARGDLASRRIMNAMAAERLSAPVTVPAVRSQLAVAQAELAAMAAAIGGRAVVGGTVVVALIQSGKLTCLWAGDSRLYRLRAGALQQLTRDHSQVQVLVDSGLLSVQAARGHRAAHVITRAVGAPQELELDSVSHPLQSGDMFLLCSDGLTNVVTEQEIATALSAPPHGLRNPARELMELALHRGAPDNVTVVLLREKNT